jgi:hypothetical protein
VDIMPSRLRHKAAAIGAASLAIDRFFASAEVFAAAIAA